MIPRIPIGVFNINVPAEFASMYIPPVNATPDPKNSPVNPWTAPSLIEGIVTDIDGLNP